MMKDELLDTTHLSGQGKYTSLRNVEVIDETERLTLVSDRES